MTVFPRAPCLIPTDKEGIMVLAEPHLTIMRVGFGYYLVVLLKTGFKTNGASVPEDELKDSKIAREICKIIAKHYPNKDYKETLAYLIGSPFELPRLLAAIVHDGLYDIKWKWRWFCDRIYYLILTACGYDEVRKEIEYIGIRSIGWKNWNKVSQKHKKKMKNYIIVHLVRNKRAEQLRGKYLAEFG